MLKNTSRFWEKEKIPDLLQVVTQAVTLLRIDVTRFFFAFLVEITSLKIRDILVQ